MWIKKCSDYKSPNCGDFIPTDLSRKCVSKGNECEEVEKECKDMPYDDCRSYYSRSEEIKKLEPKCVKKEDKSGCELKSCYFLNSNECSEFKFENYELKICAPNDDNNGCKIKECTDIPKGNCNAFNDYFTNSQKIKCIEPEEETELNCQEENKSCEEFDHNHCENFINEGADFYFDNLRDFKRCIPKADNTSCEIKRCSEFITSI